MIRIAELKLPLADLPVEHRRPADAPAETEHDRTPPPHPEAALRRLAAQALGIADAAIAALDVAKRSFDARKAELVAVFIVDVTLADPAQEAALLARHAGHPHIQPTPDTTWHAPVHAPEGLASRPVVVGFGPCGMFAALVLAQMGFRPIVLERGRTVRQRTKDTWGLWRKKTLLPESNVQFGEGGAGTFSDGKLYSQIRDPRHLGRKVMQEFVAAGAPPEILYVAHPHIGTFKLVKVVEHIREQIVALGGEIRFEQRVTDLLTDTDADGTRRLRALQVLDLTSGPGAAAGRRPCGAGTGPQRARHLRHAARAWRVSGGQAVLDGRAHRASARRDRPGPLGAATPATRCWARPTTSWCTTRPTAARSTASACAPAAPWWPPPASPGASSPTA
jgi:hypothetical protein